MWVRYTAPTGEGPPGPLQMIVHTALGIHEPTGLVSHTLTHYGKELYKMFEILHCKQKLYL